MKTIANLLIFLSSLLAFEAFGHEVSVEFSSLDLSGTDLVAMSPVVLNDDVQLTFEQGGAMTAPSYKASTGRVTLTMNSVVKIAGRTEDVIITSVSFTSPKASNTFSVNSAVCVPEGVFTVDKTAYTSTWTDAAGANTVQITNTMGAPVFTAVKVTYSGGVGGSTGPGDNPDDPDPVVGTDNLLTATFDKSDDFTALSVINVEPSTYTWAYDRSAGAAYIRNEFGSTASYGKDDYLVSPVLALKAGVYYRVSFSAWNGSAPYPERIGAVLGQTATAAGLNRELIAATTLAGAERHALSSTFTVDADGDYFAALHATSEPGMFTLYADDFMVSRGVLGKGPAEITDFKATPDSRGALSVVLTLTAPATDMEGNALASLKKVTLLRDGVEIASAECTPGQALTYTDNVDAEGWHRYTAVAEGEHGLSFDALSDAWVGMAAPMSPQVLTVTETEAGVLNFTWDAVTTNIHGHAIAPEAVTYFIYAGTVTNVVADNLTGTSATVNYPAGDAPQTITDFTIMARTAGGVSKSGATTPIVVVGKPYTMPYIENFPGAVLTAGQAAQIIADENHPAGSWAYYEQLVNDGIMPVAPDGGMAAFFPYADGDCSVWRSAKIEVAADAANPYLSFYYYTIPGATDRLVVDVDGTVVDEFTIDGTSRQWCERLISLADYKGSVIRIGLTGYCVDRQNKICFDNIAVKDEMTNNMAIVRARFPQQMHQGVSHHCSVKVCNLGVAPAQSYTLTIYDGDKEIWSTEGSALQRGETAEYELEITHAAFDGIGTTYSAVLTYANDEDLSDNEKSTVTSFYSHELPSPDNLSVHPTDGGRYTICWTEVSLLDMPERQITEGFEAYDEFVCDAAGEWSFVDGDGAPVLGIRDGYHSYPNMFAPMAFIVFNNHDGAFPKIGTASFEPYEGGQCLMSASVDVLNSADRSNDDMLISPRLSGKAQTIEFYARSSGMVFPEDLEVMWSSTDRQAGSFEVLESFERLSADWKAYEVALPEGAQYFALCNRSHDQYMLFIDNVTFEAAPLETEVCGYDVYRSSTDDTWVKLNATPLAEPSFVADELDESDKLRIATHFANGCTTYSESFNVGLSGISGVAVDNAAVCEYYKLDGQRLSGRPSAPGVYVMRRGTTVVKMIVR